MIYILILTEKIRFGEIRRAIQDISLKKLTATLRTLEKDGFITCKIYPDMHPYVEYNLYSISTFFIPSHSIFNYVGKLKYD